MVQLIIKNGRILDPASGMDRVADLAVEEGRIAGIGEYQETGAARILDAEGCLVTPGLIDHHCHLAPLSHIGLPAEAVCFASGVTTAVDAGSTGCGTFEKHIPFIEQSRLRVLVYLNVCSTGLNSLPKAMEDVEPAHFERDGIRRVLERHRDCLLGLKLRTSAEIVKEMGYEPLRAAVALAEELDTELMVHCTNPPGELSELLDTLRPGDVLTHMYMNKGSKLTGENGTVIPAAIKARERGVLFEAADAREHFSFEVSEPAIAAGFLPDILATDLTQLSMYLRPTAFNLPNQIAKYTQLGIPFEKVIGLCTAAPARLMGLEGEIGTLQKGACADIAVFRKESSTHPFGDRPYGNPERQLRPCAWRLNTMTTVRAGEVVYQNSLF